MLSLIGVFLIGILIGYVVCYGIRPATRVSFVAVESPPVQGRARVVFNWETRVVRLLAAAAEDQGLNLDQYVLVRVLGAGPISVTAPFRPAPMA